MAFGIHSGSGVRKHLNGQRREALTLTGCSAIQPKSKTIVKLDGPCRLGWFVKHQIFVFFLLFV